MATVPHAVDLAPLVPTLLEAAGLPRKGPVVRQRTGIANHVYRVAREFIVRIGPGPDGAEFAKSSELLTALAGRVRCPELLFADTACSRFPYPVMICRYVPGRTLGTAWQGLTERQRRVVMAQVCDQVQAIHALDWRPLRAFEGWSSWAEARRSRMARAVAAARANPRLDQDLVSAFAHFWDEHHGCLDRVDAPVLIHNDVHVGNILVDERFEVAALLDFDDAEVSPPEIEFWNMTDEWLGFEGGPRLATIKDMLAGVYRFEGEEALTRCLLNEAYWQMLLLAEGVTWKSPDSCRAGAARAWRDGFLGGYYTRWFE